MSKDKNMKFSLTVLPGIEDIALRELEEKWKKLNSNEFPEIQQKKGKLLLEADVSDFCTLIPYLRIPTDAYVILDEFTGKDRPRIYNKISKIPWHNYLRGDFPLVLVTTKESKIINSTLVKDSVESGIKLALKKAPIKKVPKGKESRSNKIHIDLYQDRLRVSLSLCGTRMDKRGVKLHTDVAPLRESIAAAMIYRLSEECKEKNLIDPMSGTGTFSLEAILFNRYNNFREFDYQIAPFFVNLPLRKREKNEQKLFASISTYDLSPKSIESIKYNFMPFKDDIKEVKVQDFFTINELDNSIAIINPPYGKRIKLEDELDKFIIKLIDHAKESMKLTTLALIFPTWAFHKLKGLKLLEKKFISNGGIDVVFIIIDIS